MFKTKEFVYIDFDIVWGAWGSIIVWQVLQTSGQLKVFLILMSVLSVLYNWKLSCQVLRALF